MTLFPPAHQIEMKIPHGPVVSAPVRNLLARPFLYSIPRAPPLGGQDGANVMKALDEVWQQERKQYSSAEEPANEVLEGIKTVGLRDNVVAHAVEALGGSAV